jgi:galactoside O-acetyltransferase
MKLVTGILDEIRLWLIGFLSFIPGRVGRFLRFLVFFPFFKKCGKKVSFSSNIVIHGFKNISLGNNVTAGTYLRLYASGNNNEQIIIGNNVAFNDNVMVNSDFGGYISIGNNVAIGPNVVFRASNHNYIKKDILINKQGHKKGNIIIEDDVWIAANVVILPGVTIKKGAVVAAGAVVAKDVENYKVVGGIPAKNISVRK